MKRELFSGFLVISLLISVLGLAFNARSGKTEASGDTHDLEVTLSHSAPAKYHVSSGNSATVNATVVNKGNVSEFNVTLFLLINGTAYLNATAPKLSPNIPFWATYLWTPEDGVWNLTVCYAPPLPSESNTTNNVDSRLVKVCADRPPTARFSYSPEHPVMGEPVAFDASKSTDPDDWGDIFAYSWNFTGTPQSSGPSPTTTYTYRDTYGIKYVTLTVYDTEGKNASSPQSFKVCTRPYATFTTNGTKSHVNDFLIFNATKSYDLDNDYPPNRGIATYKWDFNDSTPVVIEEEPTTNHTYRTDGIYYVNLTVTSSDDNLTNFYPFSMNVTVGSDRPIAIFRISPSPGYVGKSLTFDATDSVDPDSSHAPNKGIANYTWDFNDSTPPVTENGPTTNHNYTTPGIYNVSLTVTDSDQGYNDSTTNSVAVYFEVLLKVVDSETGNNYSVHDPGETFKINITVTNVLDLDYFEFTLTYPAGQPPPLLTGKEIAQGDARANLNRREFSDGHVLVNSTAHIGGVKDNFTLAIITFGVTNPGDCTLHISHSILRNTTGGIISHTGLNGSFMTDKPVAYFTCSKSPSVNQETVFDASSSYDPGNMTLPKKGIANYRWDFNDGNNKTTPDPITTHIYTAEGNYSVNLTVTDHEGKTSSFNRTISARIYTHDVAILYAGPPTDLLNHTSNLYETSGELPINVTVMNNGTAPDGTAPEETFDVTVYAWNATGYFEIGSWTFTLNSTVPQENQTFCLCAFKYNATGLKRALSMGNYTISANATVVGYDTDPSNNLYTCNGITVRVHLVADVSGTTSGVPDGIVNMRDISYLVLLFMTKPSMPNNWNPDADLTGDCVVNMRDISKCVAYFNTYA